MLAPKFIMEWLFSAIIVFSLYLLLRGHDSPGGGFAAGIAMSIAILIQYMARGTRQMELLLSIRPLRWIGIGLLCAAMTGAGAWLFGYPFLSSHFHSSDRSEERRLGKEGVGTCN